MNKQCVNCPGRSDHSTAECELMSAIRPMHEVAARLGLFKTSEGGRTFVAEFFKVVLQRHDFANYINERLAADFACALADGLYQILPTAANEPDRDNQQIAKALRECDWSNVPIGNKAILQAACEALEKPAVAPVPEVTRWMRSVPLPDNKWGHRLAIARDELIAGEQQATVAELQPVKLDDSQFVDEFMKWWEDHGQYTRSGGGDYERTFAFQAWRHLMPMIAALKVSPSAQSVIALVGIGEKILAKLQHPTATVHAGDMWKLEDALKPFLASQPQGGAQ